MVDLIENLKHRARRLHRQAQDGVPSALARLRQLPELRTLEDAELSTRVQRRHALAALSGVLGFSGWPHARSVLGGEVPHDFGTLMFRESGGAYWNVWSAHYDEAVAIHRDHGGFLLPYRRHFQLVEAPYVRWLGLNPEDPDWARIGRDWVRPADFEAWSRLTAQRIEAKLAVIEARPAAANA